MSDSIINIYTGKSGKSYERILLRKVGWHLSHPRNMRFHFRPNWTIRYWFLNIQILILGLSKCNGRWGIRLFNWELEIGW